MTISYYAAKSEQERTKLHNYAEAIRNNPNNQATAGNGNNGNQASKSTNVVNPKKNIQIYSANGSSSNLSEEVVARSRNFYKNMNPTGEITKCNTKEVPVVKVISEIFEKLIPPQPEVGGGLGLSAEKGKGNLVSKKQLEKLFSDTGHFQAGAVTDAIVSDLNRVLVKYDINTSEEIEMFLATVVHESKTGLFEEGVGNTYVKDGVNYCGGGYTQLTGYSNYNAFAAQMLKDGLVELDANGNNPITSIGGGAEYVSANLAWEAAGWHWTAPGNNCNSRIENGASFYKISQVINGGPSYTGTPNGWNDREGCYKIAKTIF